MLARDVAGAPSRFRLGARNGDQRQAETVGIHEEQGGFAEPLDRLLVDNAAFEEAMRPVSQPTGWYTEPDLLRLADPGPPCWRIFPREKRQDRPRMSDLVSVVKMIGARIVEVHRLFDET